MISALIWFALGFLLAMTLFARERIPGWLKRLPGRIHNWWKNFHKKG